MPRKPYSLGNGTLHFTISQKINTSALDDMEFKSLESKGLIDAIKEGLQRRQTQMEEEAFFGYKHQPGDTFDGIYTKSEGQSFSKDTVEVTEYEQEVDQSHHIHATNTRTGFVAKRVFYYADVRKAVQSEAEQHGRHRSPILAFLHVRNKLRAEAVYDAKEGITTLDETQYSEVAPPDQIEAPMKALPKPEK